jgi:uncharacterized protein
MNRIARPLPIITVILILLTGCTTKNEGKKIMTGGPEVIPFRAVQFNLADVKLLDGPFKHAMDLDIKTLLAYEPDRLLARFYSEAGLKPKAEQYHGWEDETIAGHSLGHYLSAISMMYGSTGDTSFLERVNYIINELKFLQDSDGDGYIGAFPKGKKILTEEVAKGNIRSQGFDLNGIWVPFYTQHKIMAGLRDAYRLCGNSNALEVEKRFADWLEGIVTPLNDDQIQQMLKCEHGGIAEVLADLYADTQEERYLRMSELFYQKSFLDRLKNRVDILPGKHCNTNIPKLIGLSRLYELTGDTSDRVAAEFFWNTVVFHHSYVTGGNGDNEYFGPADKLRNRLGEGTTESCNVYNMLKLTEHLFEWEGSANSADFYERALFNHILSTQNPENGRVTYNLSLDMGGYKDFQDPEWFTCCIGTGMENHSKYGRNIYYHNENELFLFQYIASELDWKEKNVRIIQSTKFPEEQGSTIEFVSKQPVKFTIMVRYPFWANSGIEIKVNGKREKIRQQPGSFVPVEKTWETGDRLEIRIPFTLRLESMPDDSSRVAVMYGPLVMAGDLGPVKDSLSKDPLYVPVLMTENRDPSKWTEPVKDRTNVFVTRGVGRPRDIELRPFYTFYDRRYTIYWDMFTEPAWKIRETEYIAGQEKLKRIKEAEIDFVQPGEMQPERNHNFRGEKTSSGSFKERTNRESRGGWFSFDMKSNPDGKVALIVDYWGGFPGAKTFDILVNDIIIATENISNKEDGRFISVRYDIPEEISGGKARLNVKFKARENNMAGPVFGIRLIKR